MSEDQSQSGSSAVVVVVIVLLLLFLLCGIGLVFLGGVIFFRLQAPAPMARPPVPGANAPLPPTATLPGGMAIPAGAITVNNLQWSQNLFDASEKILTLAKYDQIKPGTTYEELVSVLAIPDDRRPPDIELVGPESDVELKWFGGPDDAMSITVKMKGKVVIDKAQTGLK